MRVPDPETFPVVPVSEIPIPYKIAALVRERNSLFAYPVERLASVIREVGFFCDCCAKCCTRCFNGHVFLLDPDVKTARSIDPAALEPAPNPELCDQNGTFYVSGYALRTRDDPAGSCWFLEEGRCRVYEQRFSICRIYPYMLHREAGPDGRVDWRQISGLDEHGEYHRFISVDESIALATLTKEYEIALLNHEIAFLEFMHEYFSAHGLRHDRKRYTRQMRRFLKGEPVPVTVYHDGGLEGHRVGRAP